MTGGFIKHLITISRTTSDESDGRIHPNLHRFQAPLQIGAPCYENYLPVAIFDQAHSYFGWFICLFKSKQNTASHSRHEILR